MVVKSIFTVISVCKIKIAETSAQKILRNFGYKRGKPVFQVWDGGKNGGGEPKFSQNPSGGNQSLRTM